MRARVASAFALAALAALAALVAAPTLHGKAPPALAPLPFPDETKLAEFQRFTRARMADQPSAGVSLGFVQGGKTWSWASGYRDVEKKLPATPATSYRMASVTKTFTATAAARLAEQGKLDLDRDVRRYVPWFPKKRWPVSTRQLLGHLAGIRHYVNPKTESHHQTVFDTRASVGVFQARPLEYRPGSAYLYSSYGFNLAGAALEGAAGKRYDAVLAETVFGPAGMKTALVEYDLHANIPQRAKGYRVKAGALAPSERINISSRFAGGGTRASVDDMLAFARAYMAGELVGEEMRRQIETSMVLRDGTLTDYGLGFAVVPQSGRFVIVHGGGQPETTTLLVLYPAEGFAFAAAANVEGYSQVLHDVKEHVLSNVIGDGKLHGKPVGRDLTHAAWARALTGLASHGVAHFKRWRHTTSNSPAELFVAFDTMRALLDKEAIAKDPIAALQRALAADDPNGGSAYPIAGSFMAGTIARVHGLAHLRRYHANPFALVADYVAAAEQLDLAPALRLPGTIARDARELGARYAEAEAQSAGLRPTPENIEAFPRKLAEAFSDAAVVPDLSKELRDAAKQEKDGPSRLRLLAAALSVYPESPTLLRAVADATLDAGQHDEARALYQRYRQRDASHAYNRAEALTWAAKARKRKDRDAYKLLMDLAAAERKSVDLR